MRVLAGSVFRSPPLCADQLLEHIIVVRVQRKTGLELASSHILLAQEVPLDVCRALVAASREYVTHGGVEKADSREPLLPIDHLLASRGSSRGDDGAEEVFSSLELHRFGNVVPKFSYLVQISRIGTLVVGNCEKAIRDEMADAVDEG